MNKNPFERSPLIALKLVTILMIVPVTFVFVMVEFTVGGTAAIFIPVTVIIFFVFVFFASSPIIQLVTRFSDTGIEQPSIFGSKFLHWQDVKEIRNVSTGRMVLIGSETKIHINLFLFKNQQSFLSEIRSRIPVSAYPSEDQINREIYRRKQYDAGRSVVGAFLCLILVVVIGNNMFAVIFGLLILIFMLYEIRNWFKYRNLQA